MESREDNRERGQEGVLYESFNLILTKQDVEDYFSKAALLKANLQFLFERS